jgi:hypothetical protein
MVACPSADTATQLQQLRLDPEDPLPPLQDTEAMDTEGVDTEARTGVTYLVRKW